MRPNQPPGTPLANLTFATRRGKAFSPLMVLQNERKTSAKAQLLRVFIGERSALLTFQS
jgi:hypothetical protein